MELAAQKIGVTALLSGHPTTFEGEENLSRWEYEFKLAPVPNREWQSHFKEVVRQGLASKAPPSAEDIVRNPDVKDESWELELKRDSSDVVVGFCPPDDVRFLFVELKSFVKKANEGIIHDSKIQNDAEAYKASHKKEIEELKQSLDFDK